MGGLGYYNLEKFDCNKYVQTGSGHLFTWRYALAIFPETDSYGVDLDSELVEVAKQQYPNANLVCSRSVDALENWFSNKQFLDTDKILFYLDAHFPGSDYKGVPYNVKNPDALPLRDELLTIKKYRPNCRDIIICDDARIYYKGPWQYGSTYHKADHGIGDIFPDREYTINRRLEGSIIIKHYD